jgi:hypothetical protein
MVGGYNVTRNRDEINAHTDKYIVHPKKTNSVALVRKRTIPTERPPLVGEISANISR